MVKDEIATILLKPYVPLESTVLSLTTFYSVIAGVFYTEAYKAFSNLGFFYLTYENLLRSMTNIFWVFSSFLASSILLIMIWIEVDSLLKSKDALQEDQSEVLADQKPKISYIRVLASFILMFIFAVFPLQIANVIIFGYSKLLFFPSSNLIERIGAYNALLSFFIYVTFALVCFTLWRVIVYSTGKDRSEAWKKGRPTLLKNAGQIPIGLYAIRLYLCSPKLLNQNILVSVYYPILSMFFWFLGIWTVSVRVQTEKLSFISGLLISLTLLLVITLGYYLAGIFLLV